MFKFTNNLEPEIKLFLDSYIDSRAIHSPLNASSTKHDLDIDNLAQGITEVVLGVLKSGLELKGVREETKLVRIDDMEDLSDLVEVILGDYKDKVAESINRARKEMVKNRAEELLNLPVKEFDNIVKALVNKSHGATYLDFLAIQYLKENNLL